MERNLSLVKSDFKKHEKRTLPRFPFCYLTFKPDSEGRVYEIKDISHTGMQLALREQNLTHKPDQALPGEIHWLGKKIHVDGIVKWVREKRLGFEFHKNRQTLKDISHFLDLNSMVDFLKPLHLMKEGIEIPQNLKYWLRSDGPLELLVWTHADGEFSHFQILMMEHYVEWIDGKGVQTGRIISKRNVDTPLIDEDELLFQMDESLDPKRVESGRKLISLIDSDLIESSHLDFFERQLS